MPAPASACSGSSWRVPSRARSTSCSRTCTSTTSRAWGFSRRSGCRRRSCTSGAAVAGRQPGRADRPLLLAAALPGTALGGAGAGRLPRPTGRGVPARLGDGARAAGHAPRPDGRRARGRRRPLGRLHPRPRALPRLRSGGGGAELAVRLRARGRGRHARPRRPVLGGRVPPSGAASGTRASRTRSRSRAR